MKRWLTGLLAAAMLLSMAGCAAPQTPPASPPASSPVQSDTSTPPERTDPAPGISQMPQDSSQTTPQAPEPAPNPEPELPEDGSYTSKEDVALYLHLYGHLPDNFITKKEAQALGWPGGSLEPYAPGMCIGGSYFGNYEGLLPEKDGRTYTECDIDTLGAKSRGAKRIVFSNDGLIYYTGDHYASFELLYGEAEP